MGIDGEWFDARESRPQRAVMHFYANGTASVELPDRRRLAGAVAELAVSARLGRIPRRVTFPDGWRINLPTDLVLAAERLDDRARVRLGGMARSAESDDALSFDRVEDLWPAERLSPERARRMRLDPARVERVWLDGVVMHPRGLR